MSIPIEQPPESMDEPTRAWANRLMIQIAGALEQQSESIRKSEEEIDKLRKRVKILETNP